MMGDSGAIRIRSVSTQRDATRHDATRRGTDTYAYAVCTGVDSVRWLVRKGEGEGEAGGEAGLKGGKNGGGFPRLGGYYCTTYHARTAQSRGLAQSYVSLGWLLQCYGATRLDNRGLEIMEEDGVGCRAGTACNRQAIDSQAAI
ncbi:hypothetical protein FRB91_011754 [Serendipita sp. 411]|nr:hypothetical protein FRB91_011754 [Serendipita sp. 411]